MTMHHNFIAIHALAKFIIYSSFLSLSSVIVVFPFYFLPILIYFLTIPIFNPPFIDIYLSLKVCIFEKWYTDGQLKLTAASLRDFRLAGGTQPLYPLWQGLLLFKRLLTFPIGYGNDAAFPFYTGGSHGSPFLTDDSYHYISRYTSFLLQCRYQYRIPLSLSHKDSLVPVHHKHMGILYAGCSLLH